MEDEEKNDTVPAADEPMDGMMPKKEEVPGEQDGMDMPDSTTPDMAGKPEDSADHV